MAVRFAKLSHASIFLRDYTGKESPSLPLNMYSLVSSHRSSDLSHFLGPGANIRKKWCPPWGLNSPPAPVLAPWKCLTQDEDFREETKGHYIQRTQRKQQKATRATIHLGGLRVSSWSFLRFVSRVISLDCPHMMALLKDAPPFQNAQQLAGLYPADGRSISSHETSPYLDTY